MVICHIKHKQNPTGDTGESDIVHSYEHFDDAIQDEIAKRIARELDITGQTSIQFSDGTTVEFDDVIILEEMEIVDTRS